MNDEFGRSKSKDETKRDVMSLLLDGKDKTSENSYEPMSADIDSLIPYSNHPFKLYEGNRLDDMVESIRELGVLLPVIVRPIDDYTYEILSGHNRANAAKLAGFTEIPIIIKTGLTDDEAKLIVTETNLVQRSFADLSHSERAVALKHHMDAISNQGKRNDIVNEIENLLKADEIEGNDTCGQIDHKLKSRDKAAEKYGLDARTVSRYQRLSELIKPLLYRVDDEEIPFIAAVSISYISETEQTTLSNILNTVSYKVDMKKAVALRKLSEQRELTDEKIISILSGDMDKRKKPKSPPPLKIKHKIYRKYFDDTVKQSEMEMIIDKALTEYFENHKNEEVN